MEEILASIRRIIEDSDNARKQPEEQMPRSVAELVAPAKADIETFRAELGPVPEAGAERRPAAAAAAPPVSAVRNPAPVNEFAPKAFRLAEVQAQVAREPTQPKPAEGDRKPITLADVQQQLNKDASASPRSEAAIPAPAVAPRTTVETPPKVVSAGPVAEAKIERAASEARGEKPAGSMAVDWRREEPAPKTNTLSSGLEAMAKPIISPVASRQVAAAFGQLSEAFAQRANKTFDEMAEQMLRPMLQEWLDNNLPVLVERLVREEIERVARGI
jgi:cell pole-organizing protein PopZ